jgi:hypothetical protein
VLPLLLAVPAAAAPLAGVLENGAIGACGADTFAAHVCTGAAVRVMLLGAERLPLLLATPPAGPWLLLGAPLLVGADCAEPTLVCCMSYCCEEEGALVAGTGAWLALRLLPRMDVATAAVGEDVWLGESERFWARLALSCRCQRWGFSGFEAEPLKGPDLLAADCLDPSDEAETEVSTGCLVVATSESLLDCAGLLGTCGAFCKASDGAWSLIARTVSLLAFGFGFCERLVERVLVWASCRKVR